MYDAQRPLAFARTTYLDTDDLVYYNSSRETVRRRLRVREYAAAREPDDEPILTGVCALELKETEGVMRAKARLVAPADVIAFILDSGGSAPPAWKDRLSRMRAFSAIQESLRFDIPSPRVTTFYRRATLMLHEAGVPLVAGSDAGSGKPAKNEIILPESRGFPSRDLPERCPTDERSGSIQLGTFPPVRMKPRSQAALV